MPHSFGWFVLLLLFSEDRSVQANKCLPRVNTVILITFVMKLCRSVWCLHVGCGQCHGLSMTQGTTESCCRWQPLCPALLLCAALPSLCRPFRAVLFTSELACCWCHPPQRCLRKGGGRCERPAGTAVSVEDSEQAQAGAQSQP